MSQPRYFRLTAEANKFAEALISADIFKDKRQVSQFGFTLGIKDKKHLEIDSKDLKTTTEKAPGSFYAIVSEMSLETIYLRLFPKTNKDDLGIAIQKAASHGLLICEKKFYDSDNEIILWDSLQKYIDWQSLDERNFMVDSD